MVHLGAPRVGLAAIVIDVVGKNHFPQLAMAVIVFRDDGKPGVLIDIDPAFAVNVARALTQGALRYPHTLQFVAHVLGIGVKPGQQCIVVNIRVIKAVVVIGHENFLPAQQLPVKTLHRAVETAHLVHGFQATGTIGSIESHGGGAPHTAGTR